MVNFRDVNENDIWKNGLILEKKLICVMLINKIEKMNLNLIFLGRIFWRIFLSRIEIMPRNNLIFFMMILWGIWLILLKSIIEMGSWMVLS